MNSASHEIEAVERVESDLVDESRAFFAPCDSDLIDTLLGRYQSERVKVERIAQVMTGPEYTGAVQYFLDGADAVRGHNALSVSSLFALPGALRALNSRYWREALALTDVYDTMPQARRDFWNAQLRGDKFVGGGRTSETVPPLPDFEEDTVRNTLADLLRQRVTFFSERVDGIFRGLSSHHVTNEPQGFSKRMIIEYMLSYGSIRHEKSGLIHDLRSVIAKFMGRDEPKHVASDVLIREMYKCTGQWVVIDGGALRLRVYKKGTCHLEVHPDLAWRLNQVLASLHPRAIPAQFRTKPPKQSKAFQMLGRPLPFATLELLAGGLKERDQGATVFSFSYAAKEFKATYADACTVLAALGGTPNKENGYDFDYPIAGVLREVVISGCLPDQVAHQYYPTPEKLARLAVELADIGPGDQCLEPSAGQGGIAGYMPKAQTMCVEISPLHCKILESKGFMCAQGDFLAWAASTGGKFDAIVMNPPFSEGRAKAHAEAAAALTKPGGRLVAILPESMRGKSFLPGFVCEWSPVYEREFAGCGAAVVLLKAVRA